MKIIFSGLFYRISVIGNDTFASLPELMRINLSGNRFTTTFRREFFASNRYIEEIWMGDNPWRCECKDDSFLDFFLFLTDPPGKVRKQSYSFHFNLCLTLPSRFGTENLFDAPAPKRSLASLGNGPV
jgi:hypothetical protein